MSLKFYKRMFLMTLALALLCGQLNAQSRQITGTVFDSDGKTPIIGAAVIVKASTTGVTTDIHGKYKISAKEGDILEFQSLGYESKAVIVASQTAINITLSTSSKMIDDVVVTALGISREQKSLGYSVTKVDGESVAGSGSGNWLEGLSGKVAGMSFDQAGTGPQGSMRVTIRGENSLNHSSNSVLVVVDGVTVNSGGTATSSGSNYANSDAPVDFGNGLGDINPDDIASINVLKGAAAAALYGSRAANGAMIITTKSGRKDKGLGVTFSSNTSFDRVMRFPDFQTEYGGGQDMGENPYSFWKVPADQTANGVAQGRNQGRYAFGEKFDKNKLRYQYASRNWETDEYTALPWVYHDNWFKGLFQTGYSTKNIVTIDGNNGNGTSMRVSVTDVRTEWVLPNTPSNNQTYAITATHKINKALTLSAKINYNRRKIDNTPYSGYGSKNPIYSLIWLTSNNDHNKSFKSEYFGGRFSKVVQAAEGLVFQSDNSYNPYFSLYEEINTADRNRVFGNVSLTIQILPNLALDLRSGLDMNNEFRTQRAPEMSGSNPGGFYREQTIREYEISNDFLLRYNRKDLDGRLTLTAGLGGNDWNRHYASNKTSIGRLEIDNVFNLENVAEGYIPIPNAFRSNKIIRSFLGYVNLGWNDFAFLDITGRQDWTSTLDPKYNSYFYPSVGASVLLDRALNLTEKAPWLNLLKVRASWAKVANDTDPYALDETYSKSAYSGGFRLPTTIKDRKIKPETVKSWEFGIETRLLDNRVSIDATYYTTRAFNQIIQADMDIMTGASRKVMNAGEISNKGIELALHYDAFRKKNGFNWSINMTWSKNYNKLVSMGSGWDSQTPLQTSMGTTVGNRVYVYSYVGKSMHVIYGRDYTKAPKGSYYIDDNGKKIDCSGLKVIDAKTGYPEVIKNKTDSKIGNVNPDWQAGMSHMFSYKNFTLGLDFSAQWGGNCFSATHFALAYQGKLKNSLPGRYDGLVVNGVNAIDDGSGNITYQKNSTVTENIQTYYNVHKYNRDNTVENTFDTSFFKLKLIKLDYRLPAKLLKKTGFIQGATVGVYATNVFCWTNFPQFDPETGNFQGSNVFRGVETGALPMVRKFGINLKLTF